MRLSTLLLMLMAICSVAGAPSPMDRRPYRHTNPEYVPANPPLDILASLEGNQGHPLSHDLGMPVQEEDMYQRQLDWMYGQQSPRSLASGPSLDLTLGSPVQRSGKALANDVLGHQQQRKGRHAEPVQIRLSPQSDPSLAYHQFLSTPEQPPSQYESSQPSVYAIDRPDRSGNDRRSREKGKAIEQASSTPHTQYWRPTHSDWQPSPSEWQSLLREGAENVIAIDDSDADDGEDGDEAEVVVAAESEDEGQGIAASSHPSDRHISVQDDVNIHPILERMLDYTRPDGTLARITFEEVRDIVALEKDRHRRRKQKAGYNNPFMDQMPQHVGRYRHLPSRRLFDLMDPDWQQRWINAIRLAKYWLQRSPNRLKADKDFWPADVLRKDVEIFMDPNRRTLMDHTPSQQVVIERHRRNYPSHQPLGPMSSTQRKSYLRSHLRIRNMGVSWPVPPDGKLRGTPFPAGQGKKAGRVANAAE